MKWQRGDKYYIHSGEWIICRTNTGPERVYTLWREKEWIAHRRAITDSEAKAVVEELKSEAELCQSQGRQRATAG